LMTPNHVDQAVIWAINTDDSHVADGVCLPYGMMFFGITGKNGPCLGSSTLRSAHLIYQRAVVSIVLTPHCPDYQSTRLYGFSSASCKALRNAAATAPSTAR